MNYSLGLGKLSLRPVIATDAELLWPYVSDPEISKDMSWNAHKSIEETIAFINGAIASFEAGRSITWCVFYDGTFCGIFSLISILRMHRALTYDRAELAYWIGPEFQGKGIMTEAGKLVIEFAFKEMLLHKLVVGHHSNNARSKNLILRMGFNFHYKEAEVFKKNDGWVDCEFYELNSKMYFKN